jgi:DNA-binding CsgD family transcriptional regulator
MMLRNVTPSADKRADSYVGGSDLGVWSRHERVLARAFGLTQREAAVARECIRGRSNREIATVLGITYETTNKHLDAVFRKARIKRRSQLAALLLERA